MGLMYLFYKMNVTLASDSVEKKSVLFFIFLKVGQF